MIDFIKITKDVDIIIPQLSENYNGKYIKYEKVGISRVDGFVMIKIEIDIKNIERIKKINEITSYEYNKLYEYEIGIIYKIIECIKNNKIMHIKSLEDYITYFKI